MEERLQKVLAHCGVASRRKAEEMIVQGRVMVNGELMTELGVKVDPARDRITVDGRPIGTEHKVYYVMNKPRGVTCTSSDELGRKTVLDLLDNVPERVYPVGRLDRDSEGLLVLTNDGELAQHLTHPRYGVTKTYRVTVEGQVAPDVIENLKEKGIRIGAVLIRVVNAKILRTNRDSTALEVVVGEGINREVRRLFAALGHEVKRLIRTRVGPLRLDGIPQGKARLIKRAELKKLEDGMKRAHTREDREESPSPESHTRTRYYQKPDRRMGKPDPAKAKRRPRQSADSSLPEELAPDSRTPRGKWQDRGESRSDQGRGKKVGNTSKTSHSRTAPGARGKGESTKRTRDSAHTQKKAGTGRGKSATRGAPAKPTHKKAPAKNKPTTEHKSSGGAQHPLRKKKQ